MADALRKSFITINEIREEDMPLPFTIDSKDFQKPASVGDVKKLGNELGTPGFMKNPNVKKMKASLTNRHKTIYNTKLTNAQRLALLKKYDREYEVSEGKIFPHPRLGMSKVSFQTHRADEDTLHKQNIKPKLEPKLEPHTPIPAQKKFIKGLVQRGEQRVLHSTPVRKPRRVRGKARKYTSMRDQSARYTLRQRAVSKKKQIPPEEEEQDVTLYDWGSWVV